MINLIPNEEKKKIVKNFYYRFAVLFLFGFSFAVLATATALLPSYFFSSIKKNLASGKLEEQTNNPVALPDQATLTAIKDLNAKIDIIESARKDQFQVSKDVINEIIVQKMPDIKITEISYENSGGNGQPAHTAKNIVIHGTAPSRERLLAFRLALQDDPMFKGVELPISNFVKGSNIQFSISLVPAKP